MQVVAEQEIPGPSERRHAELAQHLPRSGWALGLQP